MFARTTTLITGIVILVLGLAVTVSAQTSTAAMPGLVGAWTGEATYANVDGTVATSSERFEVTKQDGQLIWGTFVYQVPGQDPVTDTVVGTLLSDGTSLVLTEPATMLQGTVTGDTMTLVAAWVGVDHGAFEMTLARQ